MSAQQQHLKLKNEFCHTFCLSQKKKNNYEREQSNESSLLFYFFALRHCQIARPCGRGVNHIFPCHLRANFPTANK